jgi:hypothetical protein
LQVQLLKTSLCLIWDNCALFQLKGKDQGKVTISEHCLQVNI